MLYPWPGGGELAARAGLSSVGGALLGLAPGALLVQQVAEPLAELVKRLALAGEYQEPEPFGLLGLLYKQFACVRRGHVHLPFLVAVVGGSLGVGRCGRPLALHDSGGFLHRQPPGIPSQFPL